MFKREAGFKKLENVDYALKKFLARVNPIHDYEILDVLNAIGRVLYEDVHALIEQPPFDRAALDGYAVNSRYVSSASLHNPVRLKVIGVSTTSKPFQGILRPYEAVRIDTGAPMPKGADSVVPIEETLRYGEYIEVHKPVSPNQNVALKGEDIKIGDLVVRRGTLVNPMDVAAMINSGVRRVRVYRRVRISIAAIGSELKDYRDNLKYGEIWEVNRVMIISLLRWLPIDVVKSIIIPDDRDEIIKFINQCLPYSDLIISIGGTSLGSGDIITDLIYEIGDVLTHGVALQPSKPVLLAFINGKPYIGVPGYPIAAAISTLIFIQPVVMKLAGINGVYIPRVINAVLTRRVASKLGYRHYVRVFVYRKDGEYYAEPIMISGAGILSSLSLSNGFLIIPEDIEGYEEGTKVNVVLYREVIPYG